jgi:hypothetical protein
MVSGPGITGRRSLYATSFALSEVAVRQPDGSVRRLLLKDLSRAGLLPAARGYRPASLWDPLREIGVYRHLLPRAGLGTPTCYASAAEPSSGQYWLLLERVDGVELWQVGDRDVWRAVAAWLPTMHDRLRSAIADIDLSLIQYNRRYYQIWARRAERFATDEGAVPQRLVWALDRYPALVEALLDLPATVIHGDFYASNILVMPGHPPSRICPVDWEMAARGPALADLATLAAGWDDRERAALAGAYASAVGMDPDQVVLGLDLCLAHLGMRMLGWASGWRPPPEHVQDWLSCLVEAMRRVGL